MTLGEAIGGQEVPQSVRNELALVGVRFRSFDGREQEGELVVHQAVAEELGEIFKELLAKRFPIEKVVPVVRYGFDDDASMEDNNTSTFNYRTIAGTERLSNHARGLAIDINPRQNPYVRSDGQTRPLGATYEPHTPGTITPEIALVFKGRGWRWGGDWTDRKDWQHFEKPLPP